MVYTGKQSQISFIIHILCSPLHIFQSLNYFLPDAFTCPKYNYYTYFILFRHSASFSPTLNIKYLDSNNLRKKYANKIKQL